MSVSFGYFFDSDKNLHELSSEISESLGCDLRVIKTQSGKEQAWCRLFGMSVDFYVHSYSNGGLSNIEDVGSVDIESLKYMIGLVGPSDVFQMALELTAMIAYLLYLRLGISTGVLLFDVQVPIAIYEERIYDSYQNLFDTISSKEVDFPQHFLDLDSRIPI